MIAKKIQYLMLKDCDFIIKNSGKKGCRGLILSTTVKDNPDFSPAEEIISYFERWYERKPLNDLRIKLGLEPKTNIVR